MAKYKYYGQSPEVAEGCFIADSADVIGRVFLAENCNIWFGSVIRGDVNDVKIGENTNVQDLAMLHVDTQHPLTIGKDVTIGHKATLHGCTIGDGCLIGMGAVILDGAEIGNNSIVAAGSIVPPGKKFPDGSFIIGTPAKVKRELSAEEKQQYIDHCHKYVELAQSYLSSNNFQKL